MMRLAAGLVIMLGGAAMADEAPVLAQLFVHSGSVAPEYQWQWTANIHSDGHIVVEACEGRRKGPPVCDLRTGSAPAGAVAQIEAAARNGRLFDRPLAEDPMPPIGGGVTSASVTLDGKTAKIPPFVTKADGKRTRAILEAIEAAVPADLRPQT